MTSAEDYPYRPNEPWTNVSKVHGLEKLCYIRDRETAQTMFDLYQALDRNEKMMDVVKRAHSGMLGPDAEKLAHRWFGESLGSPGSNKVEAFLKSLSTVKQSRAGAAGREVG